MTKTDKKIAKVMNNRIIIDGVDVSGCEFYNLGICLVSQKFNTFLDDLQTIVNSCDGLKNCYYKQLKYEEQECEKLKDIIETKLENANICDTALNYINDEKIYLQRKLDQLKAKNETYKKMLDNPEVRVALIDVRTGEREVWQKLGRKAQTYIQALDEIEGLMKSDCKEYCKNKIDKGCKINCTIKDILAIIKKAKDGE